LKTNEATYFKKCFLSYILAFNCPWTKRREVWASEKLFCGNSKNM